LKRQRFDKVVKKVLSAFSSSSSAIDKVNKNVTYVTKRGFPSIEILVLQEANFFSWSPTYFVL
jgi:hypothetical protein